MASMEALIATVNKLQDVFTTIGVSNPIDLPQIVVIGSYAPPAFISIQDVHSLKTKTFIALFLCVPTELW